MARIAGVNIPTQKRVLIGLRYIHGIGPAKAKEIYEDLRQTYFCEFDDNGNIGKRYRRQDEIGTPFCVTVDFETIEGSDKSSAEKMIDTVTIRDRDTGKQERVAIGELVSYLKRKSWSKGQLSGNSG